MVIPGSLNFRLIAQINESPNCSEKKKMFKTEQRRRCSLREDLNQALKDRWGLDGVIARAKGKCDCTGFS